MNTDDTPGKAYVAGINHACVPHAAGEAFGVWHLADAFDEVLVAFGVFGDQLADLRDDVEGIEIVDLVQERLLDRAEF